MTKMNKRSLIALLVSLALVLSLFTVGIFAEEEDTSTTVAGEEQSSTTEAGNEENTTTTAEGETTTKKEDTTTTAHDHDHDHEEEEKDYTDLIVTLSILGVIIIACVVVAIINRVKLTAFLRSVKSEMKKVVWSPKDQTRKNFLVVMVICIATIILVAILDYAFSNGISGLAGLLNKIPKN